MSDLIIVDITENENTNLDGNSELTEITGNGKIVIKNPSKKSRLWNLNCDFKETVNSSLKEREVEIGMLNPAQEFANEYEIQNLKKPSLKASEVFDTNRDNETINNCFLYNYDNKSSLTIELTNTLNLPISNIKVHRNLPVFLQEVELLTPTVGTAGLLEEAGSKFLTWDIVSLEPLQKAELKIHCKMKPTDRAKKGLGELNITYLINNHKLTLIDPEVRGLTDSMSGIDRDESSQPGFWECSVEFINESEFQVRLEDVKVTHKIPTGIETVVSQAPGRLLNPEQSWDFGFQVESKDVPELASKIEFTPLYVVITRVIGEINKKSTIYNVLSATVDKMITPTEVDAYANTDMTIISNIMNNGTENIEELMMIDLIPRDFIPPSISEIKIDLNEMDISSRSEFTHRLEIDPDNQDPKESHKLTIELANLSSNFLPNHLLSISYPLNARNPRPPTETNYLTPIEIKINSQIYGDYYETKPELEPEIKVKYVARKLKTLKSVKPGLSEGEFSISVRIQNKGEVELENIVVKEKLPNGFELTDINFKEYEVLEIEGFKVLQVKLKELKGNESKKLDYKCSGEGEYPRYEPEVVVMGRNTLESPTPKVQQTKAIEGDVTAVSPEKKAILNDLFLEISRKINQTLPATELGAFIESLKDKFPPGPVLHQFMHFANEIKSYGEKLIVGSLRDDIVSKIQNFKQKYS